MKRLIFILLAAMMCSVGARAETRELFSHEQTEVSSSGGGAGDPIVTVQPWDESYRVEIVGSVYWRWGNVFRLKLNNVSAYGLSPYKMYKLSFTAVSDNDDCQRVSLKFFDDNELFCNDEDNCLSFSTTPFRYESDWLTLADETHTETNATIIWDFCDVPTQTITLSNFSFLEADKAPGSDIPETALVESEADDNLGDDGKYLHDGQLLIQHNGSIYNALGTLVR